MKPNEPASMASEGLGLATPRTGGYTVFREGDERVPDIREEKKASTGRYRSARSGRFVKRRSSRKQK